MTEVCGTTGSTACGNGGVPHPRAGAQGPRLSPAAPRGARVLTGTVPTAHHPPRRERAVICPAENGSKTRRCLWNTAVKTNNIRRRKPRKGCRNIGRESGRKSRRNVAENELQSGVKIPQKMRPESREKVAHKAAKKCAKKWSRNCPLKRENP